LGNSGKQDAEIEWTTLNGKRVYRIKEMWDGKCGNFTQFISNSVHQFISMKRLG
jgi:hypothetical protein